MRYVVALRYLGGDFCGFQVQPGKRTVQGCLNDAFAALFGCPCAVTGCSRTDSGVHARAFCATVEPSSAAAPRIPAEKLPLAVAAFLPPDLAVVAAGEAPDGFHPRHDVAEKEYRYTILNTPTADPFYTGRAWHYPRPIGEGAVRAMQEAGALFAGRHDFRSFMAEGAHIADTVRTVFSCHCRRDRDRLLISVSGDGFLYNMVRILTGTLVEIGEGKYPPAAMGDILAARDRRAAGMTAPPQGLCLYRVVYPAGRLPGAVYRALCDAE